MEEIKESKVVKDTTTAAYSFSLSKVSANIDVMVEAGMADIIIMVFKTFEGPCINKEIKYIIPGMMINLIVTP